MSNELRDGLDRLVASMEAVGEVEDAQRVRGWLKELDSEAVVGEPEPEGYEGWTKSELEDELEQRGLPKSGNKDELIARLEEDDAKAEGTG